MRAGVAFDPTELPDQLPEGLPVGNRPRMQLFERMELALGDATGGLGKEVHGRTGTVIFGAPQKPRFVASHMSGLQSPESGGAGTRPTQRSCCQANV